MIVGHQPMLAGGLHPYNMPMAYGPTIAPPTIAPPTIAPAPLTMGPTISPYTTMGAPFNAAPQPGNQVALRPPSEEDMERSHDGAMVPHEGEEDTVAPFGELHVDSTSPESLAPWLLLLEANAPFVIQEYGLKKGQNQQLFVSDANPYGTIPVWIDQDSTCICGSAAIMKFVCMKHHLDPQLYLSTSLAMRTRTDMALDWCTTTLTPHVKQVLDPAGYEKSDGSDIVTGKLHLDKDIALLTDYFLRDVPFIGGDLPNSADFAIGMQVLALFSTDYPLSDKCRQYLYYMAECCEHWNEVTTEMREHCMSMQGEGKRLEAQAEKHRRENDMRRRQEEENRWRLQAEERARLEEEDWKMRMDREKEIREEEYRQKREEEDRRTREKIDEENRRIENKRYEERKQWQGDMEAEKRRLQEEIANMEHDNAEFAEFFHNKKSVEEKELEELEAIQAEKDRQAEEKRRIAEEKAAAAAAKKSPKKSSKKKPAKPGARKSRPIR